MSPAAIAASEAFYATLREPGRAVNQKALELAWQRAVDAVRAADWVQSKKQVAHGNT